MNRKALFFIIISAIPCHFISVFSGLRAQVPSQLHPALTVEIKADTQEKAGDLYHLVGHGEVRYAGMQLNADRMDYNAATGQIVAEGNLHFTRAEQQEEIRASRGSYNLRSGTGSFFDVVGSVGARVRGGASLLTSSNPFFFEAERVDRIESGGYRAYNAKITVCELPDPTWSFAAPQALIRPNDSAAIYRSRLRVLNVPVFYFPFFYKSLRQVPRSSGFLTPSVGNNSRLGTFFGDSFFWAINRSTDAEIGAQFLSARGWSQQATFRVRPAAETYLNVSYFGVVDRGFGPLKIDQGGRTIAAEGVSHLPRDIRAVADVNYLSSLTFRQAFTQTFNEAVFSENHSTVFLTKNIGSLSLNSLLSTLQDFQSTLANDVVTIRHLPQFEFNSAERRPWKGFPLWLSWDTSAGVVSRSEPALPSGQGTVKTSLMERFEFHPRATLPLHWQGVHLTSTLGYRARRYGAQRREGVMTGTPLYSGTRELSVELALPSLSKVYEGAGALYRSPFKHVVEPKITFDSVNGERDFGNTLLFDQTDLVTNTRQLEFALTNRFLAKRQEGAAAQDVLTWEVKQQYYFDPEFGGVVRPEQRNVFFPTLEFSGNAFITAPRRFSPVSSIVRFRPFAHYDIEFRQDYDATLRRFTNAAFLGQMRWGLAFASLSQFVVRTPHILSPPSNQTHFTVGYGAQGRAGLNAAFTGAYDVRAGFLQFTAVQVSYNNNCCGVSFEYRRFALGPVRTENQYRMSFSLANVGSFGNLKKQERLF